MYLKASNKKKPQVKLTLDNIIQFIISGSLISNKTKKEFLGITASGIKYTSTLVVINLIGISG